MDLLMPQLGGLEATNRLEESLPTRDIPIVISMALSLAVADSWWEAFRGIGPTASRWDGLS